MGLSFLPIILAEGEVSSSAAGTADFSSILSTITGIIPTTTILGVITALLGVGVGFAFLWWGARYGTRKLMASIKKGQINP